MNTKIEKAIEIFTQLDGTEMYQVLSTAPMQTLLNIKSMIEHIYTKDLISEALQEYKDEDDIINLNDDDLFGC